MQRLLGLGAALIGVAFIQSTPKEGDPPAPSLLFASAVGNVVIPVSKLDTSQAFYEKLGCKVVVANTRFVVLNGNGVTLRLIPAHGFVPSTHPAVVWRFPKNSRFDFKLAELGIRPEESRSLPDKGDFYLGFKGGVMGHLIKDPDGTVLALVETPEDQ